MQQIQTELQMRELQNHQQQQQALMYHHQPQYDMVVDYVQPQVNYSQAVYPVY